MLNRTSSLNMLSATTNDVHDVDQLLVVVRCANKVASLLDPVTATFAEFLYVGLHGDHSPSLHSHSPGRCGDYSPGYSRTVAD